MRGFQAKLVAASLAFLLTAVPASANVAPLLWHAPATAGAAFAASRFVGRPHAGILYASNFYPSSVEIYAPGQPGVPLIGTISNGVSGSYNLAVDRSGTLYVQNNDGTISEYKRGALTPNKILYESVQNGTGVSVAVGPDGTVYASDRYDSLIFAFAKGSTRPTSVFRLSAPIGVAVSRTNVLYVAYTRATGDGGVEAYPGGQLPSKDIGISVKSSGGVAIDPNGRLLVGDQTAQTIGIYKLGSTSPLRTISTAPVYPYQFVLDRDARDLYLASGQPNGIYVFDYATGKPLGDVTQGFLQQDYTTGIAIDPTESP